jgi:hypothetical protein
MVIGVSNSARCGARLFVFGETSMTNSSNIYAVHIAEDFVDPPRRDPYGRAGDFHVYAIAHGKVELRDRRNGRTTIMTASVARSLSIKLREAARDSKSSDYWERKRDATMVDVDCHRDLVVIEPVE